jgi:hypothetical protein
MPIFRRILNPKRLPPNVSTSKEMWYRSGLHNLITTGWLKRVCISGYVTKAGKINLYKSCKRQNNLIFWNGTSTSWRNVLPPSSGSKSKPSKRARLKQQAGRATRRRKTRLNIGFVFIADLACSTSLNSKFGEEN